MQVQQQVGGYAQQQQQQQWLDFEYSRQVAAAAAYPCVLPSSTALGCRVVVLQLSCAGRAWQASRALMIVLANPDSQHPPTPPIIACHDAGAAAGTGTTDSDARGDTARFLITDSQCA